MLRHHPLEVANDCLGDVVVSEYFGVVRVQLNDVVTVAERALLLARFTFSFFSYFSFSYLSPRSTSVWLVRSTSV
jgi:hypothetical protein